MDALATGYGLIEGPVWDPERGLLFSDVIFGGVHCLAPDGAVTTVFPHRRGIGGMAPHAAGGLVLTGRNVAFKSFAGGDTMVLLEGDVIPGGLGFNDMTTDAVGRIYVGSLRFRPTAADETPEPACLHVIDLDGSNRILAEGILLTNGLGFSPDGVGWSASSATGHRFSRPNARPRRTVSRTWSSCAKETPWICPLPPRNGGRSISFTRGSFWSTFPTRWPS